MTISLAHLADTDHRFTRKANDQRVRVLELDDADERGHLLVFGDITDGCLVRIHSRCLYGEVLGSDDCDCGPELDVALDRIQAARSGILVYLEQEGRGAGLIAKARGYRHSELCRTDSFTSYRELGYPVDARTYAVAARGLLGLGLRSVTLLTNNPAKVEALQDAGLTVVVAPLITPVRSERARAYLEAKRVHRGHLLPSAGLPWLAIPEPPALPISRSVRPLPSRGFVAVSTIAMLLVVLAVVGQAGIAAVGALVAVAVASGRALRNRPDVRQAVAAVPATLFPLPPLQPRNDQTIQAPEEALDHC
ncbi:GTP cyclohydrolase II [Nocardia sp. NPDC050175]|uniref:GTP cyclohydrolase II n=1 Tax=Nocardia sp. NPDC050175 TaxID=3364317 RepID=UPI00379E1830